MTMDFFEKEIIKLVKAKVGITETHNPDFGDYCFGCFELARKFKKPPAEIAKDFEKKLKPNKYIKKVRAVNGYVNFFINKKILAEKTLTRIFKEKKYYGASKAKKKCIVIDFSSPNIAKPFGVGHLRSTVIGSSLARMLRFQGYKIVGVNHLGDWGTQFGKLIAAYQKWGKKSGLEKNPIKHLLQLYIRFHKEAEKDEKLNDLARSWFKKLEDKNKQATKLWELFRDLSLEEFKKIYHLLDIEFDSYNGESFYNNKIKTIIKNAKAKRIAGLSENALVVKLRDRPPLILQKSDGATTYAARDLAAIVYRIKQYHPEKIVYVTGAEQKLHFEQVFETAKKLGIAVPLVHVPFGLIMFPEGRMSTRKGRVIFLEDVLDKSIGLALKIIREKSPGLKNKEETAKQIGIGAIIFGDLINDRIRNIEFNWERILDFEGETAPYIQYTYARASSILRKCAYGVSPKVNFETFNVSEETKMICLLCRFQKIIGEAVQHYKPHILARYLIELSQAFNEFYHKCPVICDIRHIQKARMLLVYSVKQVLENGLNLLGIKALEEM